MTVHASTPKTDAQLSARLPSLAESDHVVAQELLQIEKRDWRVRVYTILVVLFIAFSVMILAFPALLQAAEIFLKIRLVEILAGFIALFLLSDFYIIYQHTLIKRLQRQLAEKQGHSDVLRNLAMVDPLTGLYNRRFVEQRLKAEVARSERKGHPLTVLALDLNNFKQINDTYGHPAGDQVLQEFAARLNQVIRGSDLAVRLGGDEFLVLLPECTVEQLQLVLGRLGSLEVEHRGQKISVTFSAGWKQYELGERPEQMLASADQALYARKRASKTDRLVEEAGPGPAPLHVLVDLSCPHCQKMNSVAVDMLSGANEASRQEVQCAYCNRAWRPSLSGQIMAGPFPK